MIHKLIAVLIFKNTHLLPSKQRKYATGAQKKVNVLLFQVGPPPLVQFSKNMVSTHWPLKISEEAKFATVKSAMTTMIIAIFIIFSKSSYC